MSEQTFSHFHHRHPTSHQPKNPKKPERQNKVENAWVFPGPENLGGRFFLDSNLNSVTKHTSYTQWTQKNSLNYWEEQKKINNLLHKRVVAAIAMGWTIIHDPFSGLLKLNRQTHKAHHLREKWFREDVPFKNLPPNSFSNSFVLRGGTPVILNTRWSCPSLCEFNSNCLGHRSGLLVANHCLQISPTTHFQPILLDSFPIVF